MNAHTPGPWSENLEVKARFHSETGARYESRSHWIVSGEGESAVTVALLCADETKANARLIAAAPEVYAAFKKLAVACAEDGSSPQRFMAAEMLPLLEKVESL